MLGTNSFRQVFESHFLGRREDLISSLIESGDDASRFKIQMIDEFLNFRNDLYEELKAEKSSASN